MLTVVPVSEGDEAKSLKGGGAEPQNPHVLRRVLAALVETAASVQQHGEVTLCCHCSTVRKPLPSRQ